MKPQFPFLDTARPVEERIEDLLGRLTLEEKIGQMMNENPAIGRLGVPQYNWWNEACHGIGRAGRATVFPQVMGMAASWNRNLLYKVATAVSDEARAKYNESSKKGRRGQYQGLTFWTPNINIVRDPRWGRGQETYGEDPYLTGELGVQMVKGLQGDDPKYMKVSACAKHFAVHSGPESDRHVFDARPTPKDLEETYLPAFEKLVKNGVETVMGAYNRTLGEACCASRLLLGEILRKRWGFKGHVVSDCGAVDDFHNFHKVTKNKAESAALAVRNGCDLNCGCTYADLLFAAGEGLISETEIDTSVRRLLRTKFKLGLFDPAEDSPWADLGMKDVDSVAHRSLARQVAREGVVLLKNKGGLLPLSRNPERLLVVGPTALNVPALLGNYHGTCPEMITIYQGIMEALEPNTAVKYRAGCPLFSPQAPGVNYTLDAATAQDCVIAVMGLDQTLEGEEGDTVASPSGGDRDRVELPQVQMNFLRELRKKAKKLVLVLTGGSAIAATEAHELADAVLMVWYPGCEGGHAVADILFGDAAPSGRLPLSFPKATADLPAFSDYNMKGRTYRFADKEPLYPFGFGLSYGSVQYSEISLSSSTIAEGGSVTVTATLSNPGKLPLAEVAQCYVVPPQDWPEAPHAELRGFEKVEVAPGASVKVSFTLNAEAFAQFDAEGRKVLPKGKYGIVVGPCSPGARGLALGAAKGVEAVVIAG
jgi:beta-glucosidase